MRPIQQLNIHYNTGSSTLKLGKMAIKDRKIYVEYDVEFLKTNLNISPFYLPLQAGVRSAEFQPFEGLFGVFNDSLPDGWGRLLLDRKMMQMGISPGMLTPLDRLAYIGKRGMGALSYAPDLSSHENFTIDLDQIAEESQHVLDGTDDTHLDELLVLNGSSAGARPKILVTFVNKKFEQMGEQGEGWLIKFRSASDPIDAGAIEYAYHLMAIEAGLDVPEAKLFPAKQGPGYFGVKRFDRTASEIFHMHSAAGLLHADYRIPCLDYATLMKALTQLTKSTAEHEKLFRLACFNVLTHNRDDHAKNFSFLMNAQGEWHLSPAYDLTFSTGPGGEHSTTIMGEGGNPEKAHLLKLAELIKINSREASVIFEKVTLAVSKWLEIAKNVGVSKKYAKNIQTLLSKHLILG